MVGKGTERRRMAPGPEGQGLPSTRLVPALLPAGSSIAEAARLFYCPCSSQGMMANSSTCAQGQRDNPKAVLLWDSAPGGVAGMGSGGTR